MKKCCCTFLITLFILQANAQQQSTLKFGIKSGIAFSQCNVEFLDTANNFSSSGKTGLLLGLFLNKAIGKKFIFQPALLYVRKGYKESSFGYKYNTPISYMEVPLNILYALPSKSTRYFIGAGVSPAFKLNQYGFRDEVKEVDVGLNIIAGCMLPIGFSFNASYTGGLQNVSKNKNYISKIKNNYFSVTIGYEF